MTKNKTYDEGLYFNMPEDEYHSIPCFSRSACDTMIFDPSGEEYWHNSPMNPEYKRTEPTAAMKLGTALHCMLLEPQKFEEIYIKEPNINDMSDKIVFQKSDEIKLFLRSVGEKVSGNKPDLIQRAMPYLDPNTHVIWDNVLADFYQDVETNNKRILTENNIDVLNGIKHSLARRKNMPELLKNIQSEITIIWRDESTGILCKCRLDGARPEAIAEVKSFSVQNKKGISRAMYDAINYDHYNLQYYVYWMALETIIKKVNTNKAKVYGDVDSEWLKEFLKSPDKQFFMMFFRTQAPYQCKAIELRKSFANCGSHNAYHIEAESLWRLGIGAYQKCCELYGVNRWIDTKDVDELMDENIPGIMYQSASI